MTSFEEKRERIRNRENETHFANHTMCSGLESSVKTGEKDLGAR